MEGNEFGSRGEDADAVPTKIRHCTRPKKIEFGKYEIEIENTKWNSLNDEKECVSKLYICEFCLEQIDDSIYLEKHQLNCLLKEPNGKEIYLKDVLSVFEVDGSVDEQYCRNLCALSKLFLDDKKESDVEDFVYYVLTKNDGKGKHLAGYFSREKDPDENNNVSCLLILPQYQRQGFGRFLIHFSYLLSGLEKLPGTPEKPLSRFGLLTYQSYWKGVVGQHLFNHKDDKSISIQSISDKTGIDPYDIGDTLTMLNLVKQRNGKVSICIKQKALAEQMKKFHDKKHIEIDEECLHWTPSFIRGKTNHDIQNSGALQSTVIFDDEEFVNIDENECVNNNDDSPSIDTQSSNSQLSDGMEFAHIEADDESGDTQESMAHAESHAVSHADDVHLASEKKNCVKRQISADELEEVRPPNKIHKK